MVVYVKYVELLENQKKLTKNIHKCLNKISLYIKTNDNKNMYKLHRELYYRTNCDCESKRIIHYEIFGYNNSCHKENICNYDNNNNNLPQIITGARLF